VIIVIYYDNNNNSENKSYSTKINEGLIKKIITNYIMRLRNATNKMFATEIVNLGSVFDCDWQGIPKISDLLIPTTYKIPRY
jgi:hypothetical protein